MKQSDKQTNEKSTFQVMTPLGVIGVDIADFIQAKKAAMGNNEKARPSYERQLIIDFIQGEDYSDSRYFSPNLGRLVKYYLEHHFSKSSLIEEYNLDKLAKMEPNYEIISLGDLGNHRYMEDGFRLYDYNNERFVLHSSVDMDDDQRIRIISNRKGRGMEILNDIMDGFYSNGPLKNAFFDMDFRFLSRINHDNELLAWNPEIEDKLNRDLVNFVKLMPMLNQKGLPNSRGIILSGPPGTGKTMMAKAISAKVNITTILVSADMIRHRSDVKSAFETARKLAPSLVIIEDIDSAGTVTRKLADHPILGEYLQALDGMEPNNGVIVLATTNHTENIDPAISDRPGRFDRIIEVDLPNSEQRSLILNNLLSKIEHTKITSDVIKNVVSKSDGLSGAWIREIIQTSMIEAMSHGRTSVNANDLIFGLKDVLERRGIAYKPTKTLLDPTSSKQYETYTA